MDIKVLEGICTEYFELKEARDLLDEILFHISPYDRTINDREMSQELVRRINNYRKFDDSE